MNLKDAIKKIILRAVEDAGLQITDVSVMFSSHLPNGDYTSNVALIAAKEAKIAPKVLAGKLVELIQDYELPKEISHVEEAGAGFINFFVSPYCIDAEIKNVLDSGKMYGVSKINAEKKILVEHSSPNLFKPFHIGHLMNNTIGESIVRLAGFSGAEVTKISYPSDISLGIGKAIWALLQEDISILDKLSTIDKKVAFLGECYVKGTNAFLDNEDVQKEAREITKKLFDKTPGVELEVFEKCKEVNLAYFKETVKTLGSEFDQFVFESEAGVEGERIVRENIGKVFENSNDAVIYKGEDEGLHTRVFINKEGYPTYEAKDVGLLSLKFKKFNPDLSLFVTDNEQKPYFEVVASAAGKINKNWADKTTHLTHGRMSFAGKKMSSRLGGVPLATAIIEAVSEEVRSKRDDVDEEVAEMIAIAAIKFAILRVASGKNINFDPETSLSFEGDSGPYLQYTAVRAASVVRKAKEADLIKSDMKHSDERVISDVERILTRFPEVVEMSIEEWAPHHLITYLLELAQSYNSWYANTKVLDESNAYMQNNIALTSAVNMVIKNGLNLLGIEVPAKM